MRIGLLKLTDAAPVVMAAELGLFAEEGAEVSLSVEPSWANIADKLTHGFLDGAVIVPPLAFAVSLGLRGAARPLVVPQSLSLGGNTITLENALAQRVLEELDGRTAPLGRARALASVIARLPEKPVFAVVHVYSTHNLLLRYWLAAGGIDPDNDIDLVVVPPAQTVEALASGRIAGFCAGAPWGTIAQVQGLGSTIATSHDVWCNGPEKVLAVREDWATSHAQDLQGVLRAILLAGRICDDPVNGDFVARTLAGATYLDVEESAIKRSLPGQGSAASVFFRHAATFPWHSHAEWFLKQMIRWNLARGIDVEAVARRVYRPDLYTPAARDVGVPIPLLTSKSEGHCQPWLLPADPDSIAMDPDGFCDMVHKD